MWQALKALYEGARQDVVYEAFEASQMGDVSPSHRQQQRAALALFLARGWAALLCWKLGHVIECEGHAGPESGSEEFWCSRCGWSHEIIYY